jgi:beta-glucosidase
MTRPFPKDFLFGCATSAYQIEGGIECDWSAWERAGRLKDPNARCGRATDHWNRWRDDIGLLSELGASAYRFSVEWSRIEPSPGRYDREALDRYAAIAAELRARSIEPFVTLLHFTHPPWFHSSCPWHAPGSDAPKRFGAFAERVAQALGDRVTHYTVINEPSVWLTGAYFKGIIPPGERSVRRLARATAGLVRGHAAARAAILAQQRTAKIGVAKHFMCFTPSSDGPIDRLAARYASHHFNHAVTRAFATGRVELGFVPGIRFVEEVAGAGLDFLGVNFYSRVYVAVAPRLGKSALRVFYEDREGRGVSDLGWEIFPEGLAGALSEMSRYGLPLVVTENGIDDRDDSRRARFLYDHLAAVLDAIDRGIDVRGYLFWSLLDNFEWLEAYEPRFGLYRVDYETLERRLTRGGALYQRIIRERALPSSRPEGATKPGAGRVAAG